jgi:peroxiredoxin family protein
MPNRLSMVVFSGTVDRLYPVGIIASGAVAMGKEVNVFLTFWGLEAFRKGRPEQNMKMSADYAEMAPMMGQAMVQAKVPPWIEILRQAKELGNVKVHACAMTADLLHLKLEDFDPIVDDIVGVGEFVSDASDGEVTMFI